MKKNSNKYQHATQPSRTQAPSVFLRDLTASICLVCVAAFSGASLATPAAAQVAEAEAVAPIAIHLKQFKIIEGPEGQDQFVDASLVVPGDVVEYRATYANRSNSTLPVVATLPIPEAMEYLKGSAKGGNGHTVATKDAQYAPEPLMQKVTTAGNTTITQAVPYASYRFVRWDLGQLSPGGSVEVSVRAKVSQDLPKEDSEAGKVSAKDTANEPEVDKVPAMEASPVSQ